jgi:hypothetical protein
VHVDVRNLHRVTNHGLVVEVVDNNHGVVLLASLRNKAKVMVKPNLRERLVRVCLQVLNGSLGGSANHSIRVVLEVTKVINQQDLAHGLAFPLNGWVRAYELTLTHKFIKYNYRNEKIYSKQNVHLP